MRTLVFVQSREERAQIRPVVAQKLGDVCMVNSREELLEKLAETRGFDFIFLDDSIDALTPGYEMAAGSQISEILSAIQMHNEQNSEATLLCFLRNPSSPQDSSAEDRLQQYIELGVYNFVHRPFSVEKLNVAIETALSMFQKPPQWLKLLKQARLLVLHRKLAEAHKLLSKIDEMGLESEHLGFAILRARVLTQMGGESLQEANRVLRQLAQKHPHSISVRRTLIENAMQLGNFEEAFETQLSIFENQKSTCNFERVLEQLLKIHDQTPDESVSLNQAQKIFELLLVDPPPFSKKHRLRIYESIFPILKAPESFQKFLDLLFFSPDIATQILPILRATLERLDEHQNPENPSVQADFERGHFMILQADPADSKAIEVCSHIHLQNNDLISLENLLHQAEKAGAKSLEFFAANAEYFLHRALLKEASDEIHKAVKISADDPRVLKLRESWRLAYASKAM